MPAALYGWGFAIWSRKSFQWAPAVLGWSSQVAVFQGKELCINMATKTILGLAAAAAMTIFAAGDVAAHCGANHGGFGGGRGISIQVGGGGFGGGFGGYGLGGFGSSVVQTSYYAPVQVYRPPAVQVYRPPVYVAPRPSWHTHGYRRPGCSGGFGGYRGFGW